MGKIYGDAKIVKKQKVGKGNKTSNNISMANKPKEVSDNSTIDAVVKKAVKVKGGTTRKIVIKTKSSKAKVVKKSKNKITKIRKRSTDQQLNTNQAPPPPYGEEQENPGGG